MVDRVTVAADRAHGLHAALAEGETEAGGAGTSPVVSAPAPSPRVEAPSSPGSGTPSPSASAVDRVTWQYGPHDIQVGFDGWDVLQWCPCGGCFPEGGTCGACRSPMRENKAAQRPEPRKEREAGGRNAQKHTTRLRKNEASCGA